MTILTHPERPLGVATVSGSWSANTIVLTGMLGQVTIQPDTETTMYDFSLTDDENVLVYERTDITGDLMEELNVPIHGIYTMAISNSTRDESFTVVLNVRTS
jgi:hypothetical protein